MEKNIIINNKAVLVAIYIRVSTEEQVKFGYSLNSQKQRLIEYCNQKKYKIIDIYIDEGKSARTKLNNRKALLKLVEDAKSEKFERIIFWRLDRWFRNIADYYKVQEILDKHNIDWECSDEEYNTTTSNGRLHLNIKLSIAQNESDQTSDRIKFNFDMMIKNGKVIVGNKSMPIGYKVGGKKRNKCMIKDPNTEHITIDMWENIQITGSIRQTLLYINNKYNLNICYDSMRHYFMNEKYYGMYRGVDNYCPPYVTKETFDNVQRIIKRNVKSNKRHDYIFSGLLKCPICGRKLAGFTSKTSKLHNKVEYKYPSYRCNYKYQNDCTYNKRLVEKTIENYLLLNIQDEINKYKIEVNKIQEKQEETSKINTGKLEKKLERLTELYIDEKINKEKYDIEYNKINNQILEYNLHNKERKTNNYDKLEKIFNENTISLYNALSNKNKRMFWANFINYIEIDLNNEYHIHLKNNL